MRRHHSILIGHIGFYVWTNSNRCDRADVVAFGEIVDSWTLRKLDVALQTSVTMPDSEETRTETDSIT